MKKLLIISIIALLFAAGCSKSSINVESPMKTEVPAPSGTPISSSGCIINDGSNNLINADLDWIVGADIENSNEYQLFNVTITANASEGHKEAITYAIEFMLPKEWYCLKETASRELYLGATEGKNADMFDQRIWIYDQTEVCMGAIGIKRSESEADKEIYSIDEIKSFYSDINSKSDYRFTIDEYYFPVFKSTMQFKNRFEASAITEVLYTKEYLNSFKINSDNDRLNIGILSRRPHDNVYVCMEFFGGRLDSIELMDIARSIIWGGMKTAD